MRKTIMTASIILAAALAASAGVTALRGIRPASPIEAAAVETALDAASIDPFTGKYCCTGAVMRVYAQSGDRAHIMVTVDEGGGRRAIWTMSGPVTAVGDAVTVHYDNCMEQSLCYNDSGMMTAAEVVSMNGTGTVTLVGSNAVWTDDQETAAHDWVFIYTDH